jgi:hypothetical protein
VPRQPDAARRHKPVDVQHAHALVVPVESHLGHQRDGARRDEREHRAVAVAAIHDHGLDAGQSTGWVAVVAASR